jgi:hypothetical protein
MASVEPSNDDKVAATMAVAIDAIWSNVGPDGRKRYDVQERARISLSAIGIVTVGDFLGWRRDDLMKLRGVGHKALKLISDIIHSLGIFVPDYQSKAPDREAEIPASLLTWEARRLQERRRLRRPPAAYRSILAKYLCAEAAARDCAVEDLIEEKRVAFTDTEWAELQRLASEVPR